MKSTWPILTALAFCIVSFASCDNRGDVQEAQEDLQEEQQDVREAQQEGAERVMEERRDVYRQEVNVRLARIDSTLSVLEERAENAKGRTKTEYETQIADLRKRRDEFNAKMNEIQNATAEAWEDTKSGVNTALEDLERNYNKALEDMKTK